MSGRDDNLHKVFESYLIVDGIPCIPLEKKVKLTNSLCAIFSKDANLKNVNIIFKPDGRCSGFCFIEFETVNDAKKVLKKASDYSLDKNHPLKINKWSDYDNISSLIQSYNPPSLDAVNSYDDVYDWLKDANKMNQFATLINDTVDVYKYGNGIEEFESIISRSEFTSEDSIHWSPKGTYLINTYIAEDGGCAFWVGPKFLKAASLLHPKIESFQVSPNEEFVFTQSSSTYPSEIYLWDLRLGTRINVFPSMPLALPSSTVSSETKLYPNPFKWSYDDKYFARIVDGELYIYETPFCKLMGGCSMKFNSPEGSVVDFEWSPTENLVAIYIPEYHNNPTRVIIMAIPLRKEIAQKNLFNVSDLKLFWQSNGDYLMARVDLLKGKKVTSTFELFRIREKSTPIELFKFDQTVFQFAWEPRGKLFSLIYTPDANAQRPSVAFYDVSGPVVRNVATLNSRPVTDVVWSPSGTGIVAIASTQQRMLSLYNVNTKEFIRGDISNQNILYLEWDPTGRYLVGYDGQGKGDTGWSMWSITGRELHNVIKPKFSHFSWRPIPPSLITKEDEAEINKNWKRITNRYAREDEEKKKIFAELKVKKDQEMKIEFEKILKLYEQEWLDTLETRKKMRNGYDPDDPYVWVYVEKKIETLISEREEIIA